MAFETPNVGKGDGRKLSGSEVLVEVDDAVASGSEVLVEVNDTVSSGSAVTVADTPVGLELTGRWMWSPGFVGDGFFVPGETVMVAMWEAVCVSWS